LLEVDLTDEEIGERRAELKPFTPKIDYGYLKRYSQLVQNAGKGAVLK
jgi:dihydroxy-acid dehydratase